jgi:hypothetical protein
MRPLHRCSGDWDIAASLSHAGKFRRIRAVPSAFTFLHLVWREYGKLAGQLRKSAIFAQFQVFNGGFGRLGLANFPSFDIIIRFGIKESAVRIIYDKRRRF